MVAVAYQCVCQLFYGLQMSFLMTVAVDGYSHDKTGLVLDICSLHLEIMEKFSQSLHIAGMFRPLGGAAGMDHFIPVPFK